MTPSHGGVERGALVDAHVHFHDCFDVDEFFDCARENFLEGSRASRLPAGSTGCLLLTESSDAHFFEAFSDGQGGEAWSFEPTADGCSLLARRATDGSQVAPIVIVAGRQIVTRERLEVLALAHRGEFADGRELLETVDAVRETGAVPVVPWGFGKWFFGRGRLVRELIARESDDGAPGIFFLGDNGGRSRFGGRPRNFALAARQGIFVLPGSDPLPLPEQARRPGSYGFVLEGELDLRAPADGVRHYLGGISSQPRTFGRLESLAGFVRSQVGIRLRKGTPGSRESVKS